METLRGIFDELSFARDVEHRDAARLRDLTRRLMASFAEAHALALDLSTAEVDAASELDIVGVVSDREPAAQASWLCPRARLHFYVGGARGETMYVTVTAFAYLHGVRVAPTSKDFFWFSLELSPDGSASWRSRGWQRDEDEEWSDWVTW